MEWDDFTFKGVSGLAMTSDRGAPEPYWWAPRKVVRQHAEGSGRNPRTDMGAEFERMSGTIRVQADTAYQQLMAAQGGDPGTLDGRTCIMTVTGEPETFHQGENLIAYVPVQFEVV